MQSMLIIGHRGAMGHAPENTLVSFQKAVDLGADGVELDVYQTHDKKLVVIHNNYVGTTTNGHGLVEKMTLAEIKKLDAGSGHKIPTLEEVLDIFSQHDLIVNIELKGEHTAGPTVRVIEENKAVHKVIISSFFHHQVKLAKRLNPKLKTALLLRHPPLRINNFLKLAHHNLADGFHIRKNFLRKRYLRAAKENNFYVWTWTVNSPREIKKFASWGVDGLITNYPERAIK